MVDNPTTNLTQTNQQKANILLQSQQFTIERNQDIPQKPIQSLDKSKQGVFYRKNSEQVFRNIQNNFKLEKPDCNQNKLQRKILQEDIDKTEKSEQFSTNEDIISDMVDQKSTQRRFLSKCQSTSLFANAQFISNSQHQKRSSINAYNKRVVELNLNWFQQKYQCNNQTKDITNSIPMSTSNINSKKYDFSVTNTNQSQTKNFTKNKKLSINNNKCQVTMSLNSSPQEKNKINKRQSSKVYNISPTIKKNLVIKKVANKLNKSDQFDFCQNNTLLRQSQSIKSLQCRSQSNSIERQSQNKKQQRQQLNPQILTQLKQLSTLKQINNTKNLQIKADHVKTKQKQLYSPSQISINKALQRISSVNQLNQTKKDIVKQRKSIQISKDYLSQQSTQNLNSRKTTNFLKKDTSSQQLLTYENTNFFSQAQDDDIDYLTNQEKLWNAIEIKQDIQKIQELLNKEDVDVNAINIFFDNWSTLHYAVNEGYFEVIQPLIEQYNVNIDARTKLNKTSLHFACQRKNNDIIKYLLEKKANLNVVDREGNTPLHYLCEQENLEMIKLLLPQCSQNCNVKNKIGRKPLDLIINTEIKKELRKLAQSTSAQRQSNNFRSQSRESSRGLNKNQQIKIHRVNSDHKGFQQLFSKFVMLKQKREFEQEQSSLNNTNSTEKQKRLTINTSMKSLNGIRSINTSPNNSKLESTLPSARLSTTNKQNMNIKVGIINLKSPQTTNEKKLIVQSKHTKKISTNLKNQSPLTKQVFTYPINDKTKSNQTSQQNNIINRQKRLSTQKSQVTLNVSNANTKLNESKQIKLNQITQQIENVLNPNKSSDKNQKHIMIELDYQDTQDKNIQQKVNSHFEGTQFFSSQKTGDSSQNQQQQESIDQFTDFSPQQEVEKQKVGPDDFIAHQLLGTGSFGEVYLVEKISTGKYYAMKVLQKSKIMGHNLTRYAMTERNVLSIADHPFIVKLNYAFQTTDKLFLILEYCPGGDLAEYLQIEKRFNEDKTKLYASEILLAIEELHSKDIIFRDLKPDNVVLDSEGHALLTDFGLSKEGVMQEGIAKSFCGSYAYLAPEMLKKTGHGKAVDWYLLGVIIYEMLCGIPPYYANNKYTIILFLSIPFREDLFKNIKDAPLEISKYVSPQAQDLIMKLLNRNPKRRFGTLGGAEEIKMHPFFNNIDWQKLYNKEYIPPEPYLKRRYDNFLQIKPNLMMNNFDYEKLRQQAFQNQEKGSNTLQDQHIPGWSFVSQQRN